MFTKCPCPENRDARVFKGMKRKLFPAVNIKGPHLWHRIALSICSDRLSMFLRLFTDSDMPSETTELAEGYCVYLS